MMTEMIQMTLMTLLFEWLYYLRQFDDSIDPYQLFWQWHTAKMKTSKKNWNVIISFCLFQVYFSRYIIWKHILVGIVKVGLDLSFVIFFIVENRLVVNVICTGWVVCFANFYQWIFTFWIAYRPIVDTNFHSIPNCLPQ